ncbi:hypothetical protein C3B79_3430 [Aeromonas hydrophila]|nr:hypothetical protein C3B79_3430 [Aeromonas hydrophila]
MADGPRVANTILKNAGQSGVFLCIEGWQREKQIRLHQ